MELSSFYLNLVRNDTYEWRCDLPWKNINSCRGTQGRIVSVSQSADGHPANACSRKTIPNLKSIRA
jgi:hypothetical protein